MTPARNTTVSFVLELPDPEDFRHTNHRMPREGTERQQQRGIGCPPDRRDLPHR